MTLELQQCHLLRFTLRHVFAAGEATLEPGRNHLSLPLEASNAYLDVTASEVCVACNVSDQWDQLVMDRLE